MLSEEPKDTREASRRSKHSLPEDVGGVTLVNRGRSLPNENPGGDTDRYFGLRPTSDSALEEEQTRQLLRGFTDGNVEAFWRIWDLYKGHLYHLCLWQMGGVREDAEEALSRVMLRALHKLPGNEHQIQNIRAWLSKLTLNLCVDLHRERRRQRRRLMSIEDVWLGAGYLAMAAADSPEEAFLSREVFAYLCCAVNDLPSRLREPFVLRFFQEMAYRDIAECLILSTENVRKRIQQARDILREQLKRTCQVGWPAIRRNGGDAAAKRFAATSTVVEQVPETSA
jgi:RNA polymerase sigma-70 factor (ECF subfamily)